MRLMTLAALLTTAAALNRPANDNIDPAAVRSNRARLPYTTPMRALLGAVLCYSAIVVGLYGGAPLLRWIGGLFQ